MTYHYVRCEGVCERFSCNKCGRTYESRTGLNYHMASNACCSATTSAAAKLEKEEVKYSLLISLFFC